MNIFLLAVVGLNIVTFWDDANYRQSLCWNACLSSFRNLSWVSIFWLYNTVALYFWLMNVFRYCEYIYRHIDMLFLFARCILCILATLHLYMKFLAPICPIILVISSLLLCDLVFNFSLLWNLKKKLFIFKFFGGWLSFPIGTC